MDPFEIPVGDEQLAGTEVEIGTCVIVNDPEPNDGWSHSFIGTVNDIIEREGEETTYIIEDQDSDMWEMSRDKFEVEED